MSTEANKALVWSIWVGIQVQIYPIPFDDGTMLVVIGGLKAY